MSVMYYTNIILDILIIMAEWLTFLFCMQKSWVKCQPEDQLS
jgi:hypothetical protein